MTLPEVLLWVQLKGRKLAGLHFRRQHPIVPYVLDFYCHEARLDLEVDGYVHGAGDQPGRDQQRDRWLARQGVRTLRLPASEVLDDMDGALRTIAAAAGVAIEGPLSRLRRQLPQGGAFSD